MRGAGWPFGPVRPTHVGGHRVVRPATDEQMLTDGFWGTGSVLPPIDEARSGLQVSLDQAVGEGSGVVRRNPAPRRLGEIAYAMEPSTMIDRTLIARSTSAMAVASVVGTR